MFYLLSQGRCLIPSICIFCVVFKFLPMVYKQTNIHCKKIKYAKLKMMGPNSFLIELRGKEVGIYQAEYHCFGILKCIFFLMLGEKITKWGENLSKPQIFSFIQTWTLSMETSLKLTLLLTSWEIKNSDFTNSS